MKLPLISPTQTHRHRKSKSFNQVDLNKLKEKLKKKKHKAKVLNSEKFNDIMSELTFSKGKGGENGFTGNGFDSSKYVDKDAKNNFFVKFTNYNKLKRKGIIPNESTSFAFIKATKSNLNVTNPIGLIKKEGNYKDVDLDETRMGDRYFKSLCESLQVNKTISKLNFASCNLSDNSAGCLRKATFTNKVLTQNLTRINFNGNKLTDIGIRELIKYLKLPDCSLNELELEANYLGDFVINELASVLKAYLYDKLTLLNLSKNSLTAKCADSLASLARASEDLKVLLLRENLLESKGCAVILNSLLKHYNLKVLDLSWNSVGKELTFGVSKEEITVMMKEKRSLTNFHLNNIKKARKIEFKKGLFNSEEPSEFATALSNFFTSEAIKLVHLDISNNKLSLPDCKLIGLLLNRNFCKKQPNYSRDTFREQFDANRRTWLYSHSF